MEPGMLGQIVVIPDWFRLYYVLNPGMAFGMEFDFAYGKLLLTWLRIFAVGAILYFLFVQEKRARIAFGFLACMAMILGGTIGNLTDSVFYGVLIEGNAIENALTPWFHGRVIDMLYFPIFEGTLPQWIPFWGGRYFIFFSPVFNIADTTIFLGVSGILLFHRRSLKILEQQGFFAKTSHSKPA